MAWILFDKVHTGSVCILEFDAEESVHSTHAAILVRAFSERSEHSPVSHSLSRLCFGFDISVLSCRNSFIRDQSIHDYFAAPAGWSPMHPSHQCLSCTSSSSSLGVRDTRWVWALVIQFCSLGVLWLQESFESSLPLWWEEYLCSDQLLLEPSTYDCPLVGAPAGHVDSPPLHWK